MCPQAYDENVKGAMKYELADRLLTQAAEMGVSSIKWNWRGEATLHKQIAQLTRKAKGLGIPEVQLNTNGNMRGCKVEDLIDAGVDRIIFSVDGNTKNTFEDIRIGGDFDELTETIEQAVLYRNSKGLSKPFIRVQMCKQKSNEHEVEGFVRKWKDIVDDVRVSAVMDRGADGNFLIDDWIAVERAVCKQPFQRLTIGYDGKVMGCCADWFENRPVGDANTHSLKEIWNNSIELQDMRDAQHEGRQEKTAPCESCWAKDAWIWRLGNGSRNV